MSEQYNLLYEREITYDRLFRYAGSKSHASKPLSRLVPMTTTKMVSPFFGSGVFETFMTGRNVYIYGSDLFEPVVNLWNHLLVDGNEISKLARQILTESNREELREFQKGKYFQIKDKKKQAAMFFNFTLLSWNGMPMVNTIREYSMVDGYPVIGGNAENVTYFYKRIEKFYNPHIEVVCSDYEKQLERFPNMFAYLDPPYPNVGNLYGSSKEYHEEFDHERLRDVLKERDSLWILSYNEDPLIFELYDSDDFIIRKQWWWQLTNNKKPGGEVVIIPKKLEEVLK